MDTRTPREPPLLTCIACGQSYAPEPVPAAAGAPTGCPACGSTSWVSDRIVRGTAPRPR